MSVYGRVSRFRRAELFAVTSLCLVACSGQDGAEPHGADPDSAESVDTSSGDAAEEVLDASDVDAPDATNDAGQQSDVGDTSVDADGESKDADVDTLGCAPGSEGYPDAAWPQPNEEGYAVVNVPPLWEYEVPGFEFGHPTLGFDDTIYITRTQSVEQSCDEEDFGVVPSTLETWLVRLSPDGEVLAEARTAPIGACWVSGRPHRPTIRPDGVVLVMARGADAGVYDECVKGVVTAHEPATLDVLWTREVGPVGAPLAVRADNVTLVHASGAIWALSTEGDVLWKTQMSPYEHCIVPTSQWSGISAMPYPMAVNEDSEVFTPYWTAQIDGEFFELGAAIPDAGANPPDWAEGSSQRGPQIAKLDANGQPLWTYFFESISRKPSSPCGGTWCTPLVTRGDAVLIAGEDQIIAWVKKDGSDGFMRTSQASTCKNPARPSIFGSAIGDGEGGVHYIGQCRASYEGVVNGDASTTGTGALTEPYFGLPWHGGLRLANGHYLGWGIMEFGCPDFADSAGATREMVLAEFEVPSYEPVRIVRPWLKDFFNTAKHLRLIESDWLLRDDGVLILGGSTSFGWSTSLVALQTDFPPLSRCGWPRHAADNQNSFRVQTEGCPSEFPEP